MWSLEMVTTELLHRNLDNLILFADLVNGCPKQGNHPIHGRGESAEEVHTVRARRRGIVKRLPDLATELDLHHAIQNPSTVRLIPSSEVFGHCCVPN